jgi:hypothetical protein
MALLAALAGAAAFALLAALVRRALAETGDTNSYSLLAAAFLDGRLDVEHCFDVDCAVHDGKTWVIMPPFPAIVALPFVAAFGTGFKGYVLLSIVLGAITLWLWWRIFRLLAVEPGNAAWLLLALAFGSPLYHVTFYGDWVWFFAQVIGTFLVTVAIHEAVNERLVAAGIALGLAVLSRQLSLFLAPFLFALARKPDRPLLSFRRDALRDAIRLAGPVGAAIGLSLAYNAARFGSPLDTGYAYILPDTNRNFLTFRLAEIGPFSPRYLLFNLFYLLVQGFHVDFVGRYATDLGRLDAAGTSLLSASPFVLLAFFAPIRRPLVAGAIAAALIVGVMLFYHSNGFFQPNVQRYTLDWLPVVFYALALGPARQHAGVFRLLATYALLLNAVTIAVLAATGRAS